MAYQARHIKAWLKEQNTQLITPKKKPKGEELSEFEKYHNRLVSKFRQPIESLFNWIIEKTNIGVQRAANKMHTSLGQPNLFDNNEAVCGSGAMTCYASRSPLRVLNLYAGIGGNRKMWQNVKVTAVESNEQIARIYAGNFPDDKIIIGDAHETLRDNYKDFDFIWTSPPCQSHSRVKQLLGVGARGWAADYPDLKLYEEIIFLRANARCKWVVENVVPYYEPPVPGQRIGRHLGLE